MENKAKKMPEELSYIMVRNNIKFEPEWALYKMAYERGDVLYLQEYIILALERIIWILCGLNKTYHTGKLKGVEYKLKTIKIKPKDFSNRYRKIFRSNSKESIKILSALIRETRLIDKYMPRQSTVRIRRVLDMKLRK
jgi:hypothetical protein